MKLRYIWLSLLLIGLSACDSGEQAASDAPADALQQAAEEATVDEAAEVTEEVVAEIDALNEAAETATAEEPEADASDEIVLAAAAPTEEPDWQYKEGEHFRRMSASQGTSSPPDKIEIAEVFWYGCPHCYDFEPIVEEWQDTLAPDVSFVRIPVIWNPTNQVHARIMYTAESLGKLDEIHAGVFKALHEEGNMLTSEDALVEFFAGYGVSEKDFREAYNSFGVSSAVKRAENLTRRYGIRSVPVVVVNGKYATDAPAIRSFQDIVNVSNELVERERFDR